MAGLKRPFWMHQLAEYVLGGALVAFGVRSPTPEVPSVIGGLVVLHAAVTRGPISAFRGIPRRLHRAVDVGLIAAAFIGAAQPVVAIDGSARLILAGIAAAHAFIWWHSSFAEAPPRAARPPSAPSSGDRATDIGRTAGRLVGIGVNAVRRRQRR